MQKPCLAMCISVLLLAGLPTLASGQDRPDARSFPWAVTGWGAWGTDGVIEDLPGITSNFEKTWLVGIGLTREIGRTGEDFVWEIEGIAARHFGEQRHWEGDLSIGVRWVDPFWTGSFAVHSGVSMASRFPVFEERIDPPTKKFLHFLGFEAAFAGKQDPSQEFVLRLHHRSAAYGLYGTHHGGSNYVALGLRKRF